MSNTDLNTARSSTRFEETAPLSDVDVIVIGTGFSGLGMASQLARHTDKTFVVLERANDVGGTWRDNHYPGAACDQPSHLYSLSFRPNPEWSSVFGDQAEIWKYLQDTAREEGLLPHIHFNSEVTWASWSEETNSWTVRTPLGEHRGRILVSASGLLSDPKLPAIPGLGEFAGDVFHSARWNHDVSLSGKRVAVVGTGASAIQLIPELAEEVEHLTVFQRTPPWVVPRPDRLYTEAEKGVFRKIPETMTELRSSIFWENEERFAQRAAIPALLAKVKAIALEHLVAQVSDPELRRKLTPDYEPGCKRILKSSNYYPAFERENVSLVASGLARIEGNELIGADGSRQTVDALVLCTGFEATEPPIAERIYGHEALSLSDRWRGGAEAYKATSVSGFPNFFVLGGPNTGIGHNSQVYMFEAQIKHVMRVLEHMDLAQIETVEVTEAAEARFRASLDDRSAGTVWLTGGCASWYIDDRNGRLTTLWPDYSHAFELEVSTFEASDYAFTLTANARECTQVPVGAS